MTRSASECMRSRDRINYITSGCRRKAVPYINTCFRSQFCKPGSKNIDNILGGGIETRSITEVLHYSLIEYFHTCSIFHIVLSSWIRHLQHELLQLSGEFRTGKSQICHTAAVSAQVHRYLQMLLKSLRCSSKASTGKWRCEWQSSLHRYRRHLSARANQRHCNTIRRSWWATGWCAGWCRTAIYWHGWWQFLGSQTTFPGSVQKAASIKWRCCTLFLVSDDFSLSLLIWWSPLSKHCSQHSFSLLRYYSTDL